MTDKRAFEALLDEYARQHALAKAPPVSGLFTTVEEHAAARAAVLAAYDAAAGREGQAVPPDAAVVGCGHGHPATADAWRKGWNACRAWVQANTHPAPKADAERGSPYGNDADWALAIASALGLSGNYRIPIVPNAKAFRDLFAQIRAEPKVDAAADWVCVPREPTAAMINAGARAGDWRKQERVQNVYRAMLSAAPARVGEGERGGMYPEELFDSYSVLKELTAYEQARTSAENVTDVLNATVRLIKKREAAMSREAQG